MFRYPGGKLRLATLQRGDNMRGKRNGDDVAGGGLCFYIAGD